MSDNAPVHYKEHEELVQLIAKITGQSGPVQDFVIVTIGTDNRPMIGSSLPQEVTMAVLAHLTMSQGDIASVTKVAVPKDN